MKPGAFSGRAAVDGVWSATAGGWVVPASVLPLPAAVLVHETHRWIEDDPDARPVGVAVPVLDEQGRLTVHAVMASTAHGAWNKLVHHVVDRLSIVATGDKDDWIVDRRRGRQIASWPLVAVDLVRVGADPDARVESAWSQLSEAEAEVQRRLDRALASPAGLWALDIYHRAAEVGVTALNDVLGPIAEPLLATELAT